MDLLPLLNIGIILCHTFQSELVHQVDGVGGRQVPILQPTRSTANPNNPGNAGNLGNPGNPSNIGNLGNPGNSPASSHYQSSDVNANDFCIHCTT